MEVLKNIIDDRKKWYIFLLALCFLLYGNTLNNDYTIDDHYVTNNLTVKKGVKALPEIFSSYYAVNENNNSYEYRPLVKATFAIEYQLFKENSIVSHLINIVLYFFSLCLLYHFLRIFLVNQNHFHIQLIIICFAILPIHSEVVASLKNRDILLCFNFVFLSIIILDRYIIYKKKYLLLIAYACSTLAFLSKIEALPFIFLTPILFIKKSDFNYKKNIDVLLVFVLGYITFFLTKYFLLGNTLEHHSFYNFERPLLLEHDVILRVNIGLNCLGFYIKNLIFPSNLSCYYGLYTIPMNMSTYYLLGLVFSVILLFIFIKYIKKQSNLWLGILLFSTISLYLQIATPVPGILADRFVFFASAGYVIIVGYIINKLYEYFSQKKSTHINYLNFIIIIFFIAYSIFIIKRNSEWKNNLTLYKADVKKWPNSIKLNILCANEIVNNINKRTGLIKPNEHEEYIKKAYNHMLKAYSLDSTYYNSLNTLAYIDLSFYNNPEKAIYWLNKAQTHDTINYEIPLNICLAYTRIKNTDSVEKYYFKALKLNTAIEKQLNTVIRNYYKEVKQPERIFDSQYEK